MNWSNIDTMIFDMDGTLVNSLNICKIALSETLIKHGHSALPEDYIIKNMFGMAAEIVHDVFYDLNVSLPKNTEDLLKDFENFYIKHSQEPAPAYSNLNECLKYLQNKNIKLGVCTNKREDLAIKGFKDINLDNYFSVITGGNTYIESKPSPLPLLKTIDKLNSKIENTIYFGDTISDAACAHDAKVHFAWFSGGYGNQKSIAEFNQFFKYQNYFELLDLLKQNIK